MVRVFVGFFANSQDVNEVRSMTEKVLEVAAKVGSHLYQGKGKTGEGGDVIEGKPM